MNTDIAIIGAGTSGCFLAYQLQNNGVDCVLIEKSRGLGGRCSRRFIDSDYSIDLGAPAFKINSMVSPQLLEHIDTWVNAGTLIPWTHKKSRFNTVESISSTTAFCAAPSMNAWHKTMAKQTPVLAQNRVHTVSKVDDAWHLLSEDNQLICIANKVILTCPQEQALNLLEPLSVFDTDELKQHSNLPQYVCAISADHAEVEVPYFQGGHSVLDCAISENHKPDRELSSELKQVWLLHSTHEWAEENSHLKHDEAALELTQAFYEAHHLEHRPSILTSHYWRLSRHQVAAKEKPYLWSKEQGIGCCADWLSSGDIAGALTSALSLFEEITSNSERTFP
ncbi:FAD-dependent oxidoreductase [Marinomonas sp. C2222]|uniref:FAD-dependent oxidoreductase n=1 Tax=Marinomonas sargassi TaxID=2984494 RepID=A0ABT2YV74_9GAMM|nr:FAD-dependent oxidoreductase [Marinomonas sargassi]MCV2403670.1 FAD-dependent oxidoreductase [Marinomonas sargassi]